MSTRRKSEISNKLTRRRFVALVAAGSAALLSRPARAATAAVKKAAAGKPAPAAKPAPAPTRPASLSAEIDRQRAGTLETLKTIRAHAMAAGAAPGFVFRPLKRTRGR